MRCCRCLLAHLLVWAPERRRPTSVKEARDVPNSSGNQDNYGARLISWRTPQAPPRGIIALITESQRPMFSPGTTGGSRFNRSVGWQCCLPNLPSMRRAPILHSLSFFQLPQPLTVSSDTHHIRHPEVYPSYVCRHDGFDVLLVNQYPCSIDDFDPRKAGHTFQTREGLSGEYPFYGTQWLAVQSP